MCLYYNIEGWWFAQEEDAKTFTKIMLQPKSDFAYTYQLDMFGRLGVLSKFAVKKHTVAAKSFNNLNNSNYVVVL